MNYAHLHTHSDASLKDGLRPVGELVRAAKNRGFTSLALTDHGSLANAISFTVECEMNGVKPIIGVEGYIDVDGDIGHITLLADGERGFSSLVKLNNIGHASDRQKPAFTVDELISHNEGIICLTGCVSSPMNRMAYGDAKALGAKLKGAFGGRLFSEVMFVADADTWTRPLTLAKDLGLRVVITNDVHFPNKEDHDVHPILTQMKAGFDYNSSELWLKLPEDILPRVNDAMSSAEFDDAIERAGKIASKISSVAFKRAPSLPHIPNDVKQLRDAAYAGMKTKGLENKTYKERVEYELSIIESMGYSTYFLILWDIVGHAVSSGVRVGPGRGSGAGSLILYLLDITQIDPIKYNLPFERFLNPERKGMPDVDTDFDSENRQTVVDYASKRWNAHQIAIYARYSHKTLVHDLSKQLHVPRELEKEAADRGPDSAEFEEIKNTFPMFGPAYSAIEGQIRHKGKHAGGVIITDLEVPVERAGDTLVAAWVEGEHNELSYAGVVKFDLLGLSVLSALRRLELQYGIRAEEPTDNHPAFKIFRDGNLAGVFQFAGSTGIRDLTVKLQPTIFDDLIAINALYRPGALDVGATDKYPEWKKSPRKLDPLIDDILEPTYGAIVYQEQVMAIFARIMGGTLGQADLARRVIVKSKVEDPAWVKQFEDLRDTFMEGCKKRGIEHKKSEDLWHEIAAHSRYSFNRAHCVSYAYVAWETAWWKYTHPEAFYAAMLNTDPTEAQTYIMEAVQHGIEISKPHVNHSTTEYEADEGRIYMPLSQIKFLSSNAADTIVHARNSGGNFTSLEDFMKRVPKKIVRSKAREGLYQLGAFSEIDGSVKALGIKRDIMELIPSFESEQEYLGMIVPTKSLLLKIDRQKKLGRIAGIIIEKKQKESRWGPYTVHYLSPEGVFWTREAKTEYKVGQLVSAKVNGKSGKALEVSILK